MRFSEAWLRELYNPTQDTQALVELLTMAGLEVDQVEAAAGQFSDVLVGEVIQVEPHPNADKLRLCRVDVGQDESLAIVCGASNVTPGIKVPVAVIGAVLPGNFKIKKSKLRGEPSFGMLCSGRELGIDDGVDGLLILPEDAPVGTQLSAYLNLDDHIIEVDLTPNRADCLSIEGIAREVAALSGQTYIPESSFPVPAGHQHQPVVQVDADDACPRFLARYIRHISADAQTPLWMKERLRRSGLRSLGLIVDVTNYVLLELGQPLHAYDADIVQGALKVRMAHKGEQLVLLNSQAVALKTDDLVIADDSGPLALAGVMGGEASAVTPTTTDIILECAFFSPDFMMGKARGHGLHTDSSHRFERGVDFQLQHRAMERATELIFTIAGGSAGPVSEVCHPEKLPERNSIKLRADRVKALLAVNLEDEQIVSILKNLGMVVAPEKDGWSVVAPSSRFDMSIEADLIEEIARVWGYNEIPMKKMTLSAESILQDQASATDRIKDLLCDRGYNEAITYSFVDPELQKLFYPEEDTIRLKNPISADLSEMRLSIWPGLVSAALKNIQRQRLRVRLFEAGLCFSKSKDTISQDLHFAGLITGSVAAEHWSDEGRAADFYDIKGDVQTILDAQGLSVEFKVAAHPALHPGQSAQIVSKTAGELGWVGLLNPVIEKALGLTQRIFLFDLSLPKFEPALPEFKELSKFPSVRRDLALIAEDKIAVGDLISHVKAMAVDFLQHVFVFDVYTGEKLEKGLKSIGLALTLNAESKTLTDSEIDAIVKNVLNNLTETFNVKLRD